MSTVRHLKSSQLLSRIQIIDYFYVEVQNFVKIGWSEAELLRIFDFQNGGRSSSWISYFRNICQKFKFAPISTSTCKIWWTLDDPWPGYCVFSIFKMAAVCHLGFLYFHNICQNSSLPISTPTCKIWCRSDDLWPGYCVFSIFKMPAVRHLGFSYFRNICQKFKFAPISTLTCKFGEHWMIRGQVIVYSQFLKWQLSAILDFHIFAIFVKNSN